MKKEEIEKLISKGYRRTSNKFGIISRVDRPDWIEYCKQNRFPVDADWYRRCLSKDKFEVGQYVGRMFPTSNHDETGFVE